MVAPRVTVIISTFDWSTVLPYSIGSVLMQTFRDFELLVVGDGCSDDSGHVVNAVADARVRWINLPSAYLGHDDLWLPHHLECMVAALDAQRADLAAIAIA
jgi:glycosyltransferase involved in cell wall biosynthesis